MIIHVVRFQSSLSDERIAELFQTRAPEYLAVPGLLQKYYLRFRSGEHGGVYVWDSAASMEQFLSGDLARSICDVYRVEESVRDVADVLLALRGEDSPSFLIEPPSSSRVKAAYEADVASDGYVNNHTRLWGWRPDVMTELHSLCSDLTADSGLSPREVAVMVTATAAARGDSYCSLAWGQKLADLSDETTAANVITGHLANLSVREAALAGWSRQLVRDPNATTRADVDRLRQTGLSDREIFEATTWIAMRMAISTVNDALGARPDRQLVQRTPQLVRNAVTFGRLPSPAA